VSFKLQALRLFCLKQIRQVRDFRFEQKEAQRVCFAEGVPVNILRYFE